MARKLRAPDSNDKGRSKPFNYNTDNFGMGIIKDMPATEIPDNSLADGENVNVYPGEVQGRLGTELYTNLEIPPLTGREGLTASKTGYIITTTANQFTIDDVSNYFVWSMGPNADPVHEEIIRFINGFSVEVAVSSTVAATGNCYLRGRSNLTDGKGNGWGFHKILKKQVHVYGDEIWITDVAMTAWTKCLITSRDKPSNALSFYQNFDENSALIFNSNGIFKVDLLYETPIAYKFNSPIPDVAISAQPETGNTSYQYGYIYSTARLAEHENLRGRLTPVRIEQESGTNAWGEDLKDFRDVWTRYPIGTGFDQDGEIENSTARCVGPLYVPQVPSTSPVEYEWHLTHFPIYRTGDKQGLYKQGIAEAQLNEPEKYVWVKDLRICGAFYARKYNGKIEAAIGEFEEADVGSTIEFEDGSRETVMEYIDTQTVRYTIYDYYAEETGFMAAALGNGRVFKASQTGTLVTRTAGYTFAATDVGNTLTWAIGYRSYIVEYLNANNVIVSESFDKAVQGVTCDPIYRYYNDTVSDDVLRTREIELLCRTRFLQPLQNCNIGVVVPGFMVTTRRGTGEIRYSSLPSGYEYYGGYHNIGYQTSNTIKDDIQTMIVCPNKVIALCSNRTWHTTTNTAETLVMPKSKIVFTVLPGWDILDGNIGCFDHGSIREIESGIFIFLTEEPGGIGWRKFNGFQYGNNLLEVEKLGQSNWLKAIKALQKATCSIYDGVVGLLLWGKE